MKKLICLFLISIGIFFICNLAFSNGHYWTYHQGNHPESEDLVKAKINTAIALQKIAEEGITIRLIIENKEVYGKIKRTD